MLNQIQLHIHSDEAEQQKVEVEAAVEIRRRHREGIDAFRRNIPSLLSCISNEATTNSTILCNKFGEINIVNVSSGQVLYGLHPVEEVCEHFRQAMVLAEPVYLVDDRLREPDVLVILGLGLGYYLPNVIEENKYKNIVIYEPNEEHFVCSLSAIEWRDILSLAKKNGIGLFLQIGENGKKLVENIEELQTHLGCSGFYFYKHLNNPVFDEIEYRLRTDSWSAFTKWNASVSQRNPIVNYVPQWTFRQCKPADDFALDAAKRDTNLQAFKKYFPDIYKEFADYKPDIWSAGYDSQDQLNIVHRKTQSWLYHYDAETASTDSFQCFAKHPHKDGIVLGYKGKKLRNYLHYQMVMECEKVLKGVEDETGNLPEQIKSIIFFGMAAGFELEHLIHHYDVEKLFICEPNKDFFYASLYALDWEAILTYFSQKKRRLYLNIGDDGTNLTNDLLVQFQSIGPYVLANTYFYQIYYNEHLVKAVSQLREQLQVMIAMGDYFDNARYGISHTYAAIKKGTPFLRKGVSKKLSTDDKDVPVFVVGNGPSLDQLLPLLKEEADKAIVVSCGTALQTLHKHGITPDFHAEIEANRSTYDWAVRVNDPDYLKSISLISCNGIHPDTCNLYRDVFLAFKQGEASTVSIQEVLGQKIFAALDNAYPTVTNFAVNFFTEIGFSQFYLFGTDLGFVDENHHHSKTSGYYDEKGQDLYDYTTENNTSLVIPGNFRPFVNTKYEFKVSKSVLETTLQGKRVDVYNLNDGAKINGTRPLHSEDAIVISNPEIKQQALDVLKENGFTALNFTEFDNDFSARFNHAQLLSEIDELIHALPAHFAQRSDVAECIEEQRNILVASLLRKRSLLFFYLNGTLNYINSSLTKVVNLQSETRAVELGEQLAGVWKRYLSYIRQSFDNQQFEFDNITSFMGKRRALLLNQWFEENPVRVKTRDGEALCSYSVYLQIANKTSTEKAPLVYVDTDITKQKAEYPHQHLIQRREVEQVDTLFLKTGNTVYLPGSYKIPFASSSCNEETCVNFAVLGMASGLTGVIIVPKLIYCEDYEPAGVAYLLQALSGYHCYGGADFLIVSQKLLSETQLLLNSGDRLCYLPELKALDFMGRKLSADIYESRLLDMVARGIE